MRSLPQPLPPLEDGVVRLRAWREDDLWARVAAWRDQGLMRFMLQPAPRRPTLAAARDWVEERERRRRAGEALFLVVVGAADDRALGSVWLASVDLEQRRGELGYWLLEHARGRGLAARAVRLLCHYGFAALRLERIELFTELENDASQRLAERAGFEREGLLRGYRRRPDGSRVDLVAYALLAGHV